MSLSKAEVCAKTICCLSAASSNRQFDERYFLAKFYPDSGRDEFCFFVSRQRTHKYNLRKKIERKAKLYPNPNNGEFTLAYDLKEIPKNNKEDD